MEMANAKIGKITIKREWKLAFWTVWIVGMLSHAYRFFNFLPIWDSMYNFTGTGETFSLGRWFLGYVGELSSLYDLPWVNGALSLFFISIAMILLTEMFRMESATGICMMAALFVSFPTVASSFAYMFTADAYMLAFLLSVAAVYLTGRFPRWGMFGGMVLLALAMGIYQAYATTAIVLILVLVFVQLVRDGMSLGDVARSDWVYPVMLCGGGVLYFAIQKIFMAVYQYGLSAYQGVGSMGILTPGGYKNALLKTRDSFLALTGLDGAQGRTSYTFWNELLFVALILLFFCFLVQKQRYRRISAILGAAAALLLMPIGAYAINFTTTDVTYHTLMEMGVCCCYLPAILLAERADWDALPSRVLKILGSVAACGLIYHNVVNCNIAYYNLNLSYHKSYAVAENILDRMEETEDFHRTGTKVAILGTYECPTEGLSRMTPDIMGISNDSFLNDPYHYVAMWNYCFGVATWLAPEEEIEEIEASEAYREMAVYPAKGSVQKINGCIVVRLSE